MRMAGDRQVDVGDIVLLDGRPECPRLVTEANRHGHIILVSLQQHDLGKRRCGYTSIACLRYAVALGHYHLPPQTMEYKVSITMKPRQPRNPLPCGLGRLKDPVYC